MPQAIARVHPAVTRNELAWLATLEDVESRIVFVDRDTNATRYRVKTGPFDAAYLQALPKRDWTLLVHDVEKHLPALRALFAQVPFNPDWRIDDLMVSFAAPGGSVGPHRDHYDVFLCQGIGIRNWRLTTANVANDIDASSELALTVEFDGEVSHDTSNGDVLYLPPGVAHWGTATRASITYSIGMRAPQRSDLMQTLSGTIEGEDAFYEDPDLEVAEARPGYLSPAATRRTRDLLGAAAADASDVPVILGRSVTRNKDWLRPDGVEDNTADDVIRNLESLPGLAVHGMSRIAFDNQNIYVNGHSQQLSADSAGLVAEICTTRGLQRDTLTRLCDNERSIELLKWLLKYGAFEVPEHS